MNIRSTSLSALRIRVSSALIPVLVVLSIAAAFVAGKYVGTYDAEQKFSTLGTEISNQTSVETLFMLNSVTVRLRESKFEEANVLLARYAQLQVPGVLACSKSPMCTRFSASHMPSPAELQQVGSLHDPLPVRR